MDRECKNRRGQQNANGEFKNEMQKKQNIQKMKQRKI